MRSIHKGSVAMKASDAYALLRSGKLDLITSELKNGRILTLNVVCFPRTSQKTGKASCLSGKI